MNRYCTKTPIWPAQLPPHGGTMLVFHEDGKAVEHIEYIRRTDAESAALRWMSGESLSSIKKSTGGNAGSSDSSNSSNSSPPSLTPKPTRPKPPSM